MVPHLGRQQDKSAGGDGSLIHPIVHGLIQRDAINRKGTLFTVVGRATFSAGVMLA